MYSLSKIAEICQGKFSGMDHSIEHLLTDSRKVHFPASSLFIALKGPRNNGHAFIPALSNQGVLSFLVSEEPLEIKKNEGYVVVEDTLQALQKLAAWHRAQFRIPLIGITGSNGKTIVKEWLSQICLARYKVIKNPKSYNSQIGVPLSVWEIDKDHNLGIFEAGISMPDEMPKLAEILRPSFGIFTNIGTAHDEGFENRIQKIKEKLKLFHQVEWLLYRNDYKDLEAEIKAQSIPGISWSADGKKADIQVSWKQETLRFIWDNKHWELRLPFQDNASRENMTHAVLVAVMLGLTQEQIQSGISGLQSLGMRLALQEAVNNCLLIDDSYSNDLAGLSIALDFLKQQGRHERKTLILSDLSNTSGDEKDRYANIARLLKERDVQRLIGIGPELLRNQDFFVQDKFFYPDTESFLNDFESTSFRNETILVKGGRRFGFERISKKLRQRLHGTYMEVNLDALAHNLNFYRSKLKPSTKIMVMVKAFAYGSGSHDIAHLLQFHRCDYLAVAYADEGIALRQHGVTLPIMVMNPNAASFEKLIQYKLEPELYSPLILDDFILYLKRNQLEAKAHIKLDTGMHRLGFEEEHLEELCAALNSNLNVLKIASVFTHLAGADEEEHNDFSETQIHSFTKFYEKISSAIGYRPIAHVANSAGIVRFPDAQLDMVRLGIGLYGVEASGIETSALQVVGTLKTVISQIKNIPKGESIGYSRKWKAEHDMKIATIAIGYADGFNRKFSNGIGVVSVNGVRCPIVGNVCMDMCMVDITNVNAKEGDEVVLFGNEIKIQELAERIGTIPYEILTNVSERVNRIFYSE